DALEEVQRDLRLVLGELFQRELIADADPRALVLGALCDALLGQPLDPVVDLERACPVAFAHEQLAQSPVRRHRVARADLDHPLQDRLRLVEIALDGVVVRERVERTRVLGTGLASALMIVDPFGVLTLRDLDLARLQERVEMVRLLFEDLAEVAERIFLASLDDGLDALVVALLDGHHPLLFALAPPPVRDELPLAHEADEDREREARAARDDDDNADRKTVGAVEDEWGVEDRPVGVEPVEGHTGHQEPQQQVDEGTKSHPDPGSTMVSLRLTFAEVKKTHREIGGNRV